MGKICTFCQHKRSENRCSLVVSEASVEYTERCCYYEPVEEVAPVVHAHWIKLYNHIKCSNCGVVFFNQPSDKFKNYCSKCGAKMDEEVNK